MPFQQIMRRVTLNSRSLFLIDALGALLSAFSLGIILVIFENFFGMPSKVLYFLAAIACIFSVYSFSCYARVAENWRIYMKAIAIANLSYCLLTLGLVFYFIKNLTFWGVTYFLLEITIVVALAMVELRAVRITSTEKD